MYDWRVMFVLIGLGGLVWLVPWLSLVKNDDRELARVAAKKDGETPIPFGRIMASPVIWGTIIASFCYIYFVYFCMTWMPAYFMERRHLSLGTTRSSASPVWPRWLRWPGGRRTC